MIAPETITRVRDETDIVALIGENVRLEKRGRSHIGLCPFHKEKSPSFHVSRERARFHCFGCQESGSAIDYLMKLEGLSFPEAVRNLAERAGIALEESGSTEDQRADARRRRERDELHGLNHMAATYFEQQLDLEGGKGHPLASFARDELLRRGLRADDETAAEAMRAFRVGYAPHGWDGLYRFLVQQGAPLERAADLGLLVRRDRGGGGDRAYFDRFRHRLMFAVMDIGGRVVAFSGRALAEPPPQELARLGLPPPRRPDAADQGPPKYINSPESPIYTKGATVFGLYQARQAVRQEEQAVLVEGNFDVLSLHARGLKTAVAPLGTAFTVEQARLLKRYAPTVIVLFDGDAAGRKATRAAREPCQRAGLFARVGRLPDGVDPDDLALRQGAGALQAILKSARGMLDHLVEEALDPSAMQGGTMRERQARMNAVIELIRTEPDPGLRALAKSYADEISSRLVIGGQSPQGLQELERLLGEAAAQLPGEPGGGRAQAGSEPRARPAPPRSARAALEQESVQEAILGVLLDFPELLEDLEAVEPALRVLDGEHALAVNSLRRVWEAKNSLDSAELLALLPEAIHSFAVARLASPAFDEIEEARNVLVKNANILQRRSWSQEVAQVADELAKAEQEGDEAERDRLLRELSRRSKQKRGLS